MPIICNAFLWGKFEAAKLLIANKARIDVEGYYTMGSIFSSDDDDFIYITPLKQAISRKNYGFVEYLLENKASPDFGTVPPLHVATASDQIDMVELLIEVKANPFIKDERGVTPLASMTKHYSEHSNKRTHEIIETLITAEHNYLAEKQNSEVMGKIADAFEESTLN